MQHTDTTTGVAVVATQLAHTDRRALSQAWYSALHLAGRPPAAARGCRAHPPSAEAARARSAPGAQEAPRHSAHAAARSAARAALARAEAGVVAERRTPQTELARRIERRLTQRPPGAPASFAVRGAGGRVHVIVRSEGARTRVVAVCAPPLRERVERALAHARFALACCGLRAEVA